MIPRKEPKAAFPAVLESLRFINSPIKAPTKGPIKTAKGIGIKIPAIRPRLAPIIPFLLPPNFLVPIAGITQSSMNIRTVTTRVIPNNQ